MMNSGRYGPQMTTNLADIPIPMGDPPQQQPSPHLQQQAQPFYPNQFQPIHHFQSQTHLQQQQQQQQLHHQQQQHLQHPPQQYQQHLSHQQQPSTVFGGVTKPTSFGDLAKQADNVMTSTLQQYGPGIGIPSSANHVGNATMQHRAQPMFAPSVVPTVPVYQIHTDASQSRIVLHNSSTQLCRPQPVTGHPSIHNTNQTAMNNNISNSTNSNNNNNSSPSLSDPPRAPISPPLDALNSTQNRPGDSIGSSESVIKDVRDEERVQRQKRINQIRDKTRHFTMNELTSEYRDFERLLDAARKKRADCEREIADIQRKAHGQNLDLNANFLKKKDVLSNQDKACRELSDGLKLISDHFEKRFDSKIAPISQANQNSLQRKPRAKMSTASPSLTRAEVDKNDGRCKLFDLKDGSMWCKDCDVHYPNMKEYCDHLHKRDHKNRTAKPAHPPWRTTNPDRITRKKSYDQYKSICATLSNKIRSTFTVQDLGKIIDPSPNNSESSKILNLNRERGEFYDGDPLFGIKGYDLLIPIDGFFCKLCNCAICDFQEAEMHLKSYQHNSEHAKSVALNPEHEKKFRLNMMRSLKRQAEENRPKALPTEPSQPIPSTSKTVMDEIQPHKYARDTSDTTQYSARLPYKKPTSHIVDDHEAVADKFDKRNKQENQRQDKFVHSSKTTSSKTATNYKSAKTLSPRKAKRREVPEIVPITRKQPAAALKRLRTDKSGDNNDDDTDKDDEKQPAAASKLLRTDKPGDNNDDDTDKDDDNQANILEAIRRLDSSPELSRRKDPSERIDKTNGAASTSARPELVDLTEEVHMLPNDPESPFPDLELVVTGNIHCKALCDKRLAQPTRVVMNRINIEDYDDMLLGRGSIWTQVGLLMAKKEPGGYNKDLDAVTHAEPCYVQLNGESVPVELDRSSNDGEEDEDGGFKMEHLQNFFCES